MFMELHTPVDVSQWGFFVLRWFLWWPGSWQRCSPESWAGPRTASGCRSQIPTWRIGRWHSSKSCRGSCRAKTYRGPGTPLAPEPGALDPTQTLLTAPSPKQQETLTRKVQLYRNWTFETNGWRSAGVFPVLLSCRHLSGRFLCSDFNKDRCSILTPGVFLFLDQVTGLAGLRGSDSTSVFTCSGKTWSINLNALYKWASVWCLRCLLLGCE